MNGLKDSDTYDLPMQKIMILINMGLLYLECGHYVDSENSFFRSLSDFADKTRRMKSIIFICMLFMEIWQNV